MLLIVINRNIFNTTTNIIHQSRQKTKYGLIKYLRSCSIKNYIHAVKGKLGKFYIYFYSGKNWPECFTDSGNCDGINLLVASYYIQSITDTYKTETYLDV